MFKTKQHAEGYPKEDLKLIRGYIKALDRDIKEAAEKAAQFKKLELELEIEGTNDYLEEIAPRDFYDLLTQVMRDLKAVKKTFLVMESKIVRVVEQSKSKQNYKFYEWLLLVPLFVKFGWVKHGEISAGKGSTLREGSRQCSQVRVRW
jgi:hypothetical protein